MASPEQNMPEQKKAEQKKADAGSARPVLRLQYYRSAICAPKWHKQVVRGLGFTRMNQIVEREDTPAIRGMAGAVPHLVRLVDSRGR